MSKKIIKNILPDSESNDKKNIIKKKVRPTKEELYKYQKEEVLLKLFDILGIDFNDTAFFYIDDISDDTKDEILELSDDVKRYFNYSNWPFFKKANGDEKAYLSLLKSILKDMGYTVCQHNKYITKNGVRHRQSKVCIDKNNLNI
jgi:hypothetical protein